MRNGNWDFPASGVTNRRPEFVGGEITLRAYRSGHRFLRGAVEKDYALPGGWTPGALEALGGRLVRDFPPRRPLSRDSFAGFPSAADEEYREWEFPRSAAPALLGYRLV